MLNQIKIAEAAAVAEPEGLREVALVRSREREIDSCSPTTLPFPMLVVLLVSLLSEMWESNALY